MKIQMPFQRAMLAAAMMCSSPLAVAAPFVASQPAPSTTQQPAYGYQPYAAAQQPAAPAYGYPATAPQTQPGYAAVPGYGAVPAAPAARPQSYTNPHLAYRGAPTQELPGPAEAVTPLPAEKPPVYESAPTYDYSAASSAAPATAAVPAGDCNCNTGAAPASSWQGYASGSDCNTGGICGGSYDTSCYTSAYAPAACGPSRQWFAGVYGLYMQRDRSYGVQTSVMSTTMPPSGYYPSPADTYVLSTDADPGYAAGAEIRFGSTFGHAGCGCDAYQPFAWEVVYWALDDDDSQALLVDTLGSGMRIYSRVDYNGLDMDRYSDTTVVRPISEYVDFQPRPDAAVDDVRVLANRVRQSFRAQNLELNFWRFGAPAPTGGCGYGAASCGSSACGSTACGSCAPACDLTACCAPRQRFFISGLAGVRFVQFDEYFQNGIYYTLDTDGDGTPNAGEPMTYPAGFPVGDNNHILHDIDVDNDLVGFQLGCSMNCLIGCKWSLFADTNFGIYANDADVYQRVYNLGDGTAYFSGTTTEAAVRSSKQDVAFLGEARLGFGYQMSCRWRATAAWRVMAASGVALASDQIPTAGFTNANAVGYIHSNGSLLLHGLQAGVECKY